MRGEGASWVEVDPGIIVKWGSNTMSVHVSPVIRTFAAQLCQGRGGRITQTQPKHVVRSHQVVEEMVKVVRPECLLLKIS